MTDREKLIELLMQQHEMLCDECVRYPVSETAVFLADFLLANGVTFGEDTDAPGKWIRVKDRLPERTMPPHDVLVYHDLNCGMYVDRAWYSHEKNKWRNVLGMNLKVTHWMPIPKPPKEG